MLKIESLTKTFQADSRLRRSVPADNSSPQRVRAVDGVTLEVEEGELFTLLGPSGCGKTTTLRSIAGLDRPDSGVITIDGRIMFANGGDRTPVNLPADARGLGMVFQSYAIWPHMTVFANVAFPLEVRPRRHRLRRADIAERVLRVLGVMELEGYAERRATQLSGGQQQRLALARAIVTEPPLLLLDEPLSNLDAKLRESLRFELKRLQQDLGITAVYVTHDQAEALSLSSRIAVMNAGQVEQVGTPQEIYERPATRFVSDFIGASNVVAGTVLAHDRGALDVDTAEGRLVVRSASSGTSADVHVGADVTIAIRPELVEIHPERSISPVSNEWAGIVENRAYLGDAVDHIVAVGKLSLRVRSGTGVALAPGQPAFLRLAPEHLAVLPSR